MQLVAASKMKAAEHAAKKARPYAAALSGLMARIAAEKTNDAPAFAAPKNPASPDGLIVVGPDRGLSGSFSAIIFRESLKALSKETRLFAVGRKSLRFAKSVGRPTLAVFDGFSERPAFHHAAALARAALDAFAAGEVSSVSICHAHFVNPMLAEPRVLQLLPFVPAAAASEAAAAPLSFEPSPAELFDYLLPRFVEASIWHAFLEHAASEHSARAAAMKAATDNAKDLQADLTLEMNSIRQAAITTEIAEIVGGAAALSH